MITTIKRLSQYNRTAEDIAETLGYNVQWVRHLARTGRIPAIKRVRQWLFCEQEVLTHLKTGAAEYVRKNTI